MTAPTDSRPTWSRTWLDQAAVIAKRSRCVNAQVGAVVVSGDNRFNWQGYNGPPAGLQLAGACSNWCPRARGEGSGTADYSACSSIHAEINVLLRADASLIGGGTMYVTRAPCINCARVIANSGLATVRCEPNDTDDPARAREVFLYLAQCRVKAGYHGGEPAGREHL